MRGTNLVAKYNYLNGAKSEYTYYTQNAHGDVVNLTDKAGAVVKSYTYDAFGVEQNIDDSDANAFRYCGEYYDAETGTIYLRARYYVPTIRCFISRDTFPGKIEDPLSLNLYTYCGNNPIRFTDPTGHLFEAIGEFFKELGQYFSTVGSSITGQITSYAGALIGALALTIGAIGIGAYKGTIDYLQQKELTKSKANVDVATDTKTKRSNPPQVYYYYTNEENAMKIMSSGMILHDQKGRVYLTPYQYSPDEVSNALFMGRKDYSYGEYRVEVVFWQRDPCLNRIGATQPNEIIYHGTIRQGRNATIIVKKNDFESSWND